MGTFQMPEFNFRLRRALDPFGSQEPGRKFGGVSFLGNQSEEQSPFETQDLPSFGESMPDYSQMYGETGPATKRYQQHLSQVPRMQDYAPTKWRRLGAVLTGINQSMGGKDGYAAARNVVLDPYKTAYEDWMGRGEGAKEAATLEEASANKKAALYQKILSDYMEQRKWQADYEIKMRNAKTAEERNEITRAYNEMMGGIQTERNRIANTVAGNNRDYQQGSLRNQATANSLRRYGIDTQKYGIETGRYTAQKQRELAERQGQYGPISSGNQQGAQQLATDQMYQEMLNDPEYAGDIEKYFIVDENGAPIMTRTTLPGKYAQKFQNAVNQSYVFSGRR